MKRMWVNQPSTLQPYHAMHGTQVLAVKESSIVYRAYLLSGPTISMQITSAALSDGWPA